MTYSSFFSKILVVNFGELEISNATVLALVVIAIFVFVAVGLSSLKLIQSAFDDD